MQTIPHFSGQPVPKYGRTFAFKGKQAYCWTLHQSSCSSILPYISAGQVGGKAARWLPSSGFWPMIIWHRLVRHKNGAGKWQGFLYSLEATFMYELMLAISLFRMDYYVYSGLIQPTHHNRPAKQIEVRQPSQVQLHENRLTDAPLHLTKKRWNEEAVHPVSASSICWISRSFPTFE